MSNEMETQDTTSEQTEQTGSAGSLTIQLVVPPDQTYDKEITLEIERVPIEQLWEVYQTLQEIEIDRVKQILDFASALAGKLQKQMDPLAQRRVFYAIWDELNNLLIIPGKRWTKDEDLASAFTYALLRQRVITHEQSAIIASQLLKKPFSTSAWRRRIARWANRYGLPQVEQRNRSKR